MKKAALIILLLLFPVGFVSRAYAGMGVSPGAIINDKVAAGTTFTQDVYISRSDPDINLSAEITVESSTDSVDVSDWVRFEPGKSFTLPKGENQFKFKVLVDVPVDTEPGEYSAIMRLSAAPEELQEGIVNIAQGVRFDLMLTVTDEEIRTVKVRLAQVDSFPQSDPLKVKIKVQNEGNVEDAPNSLDLSVYDLDNNLIETYSTTSIDTVKPYETDDVYVEFDHSLDVGDYYAEIAINYNEKDKFVETSYFTVTAPLDQPPDEKVVYSTVESADNVEKSYRYVIIGGATVLVFGLVGYVAITLSKERAGVQKSHGKKKKS